MGRWGEKSALKILCEKRMYQGKWIYPERKGEWKATGGGTTSVASLFTYLKQIDNNNFLTLMPRKDG